MAIGFLATTVSGETHMRKMQPACWYLCMASRQMSFHWRVVGMICDLVCAVSYSILVELVHLFEYSTQKLQR